MSEATDAAAPGLRLDRWLWFARFFKSRSLAARVCVGGRVRMNRTIVTKASQLARIGDVVSFPQGRQVRIVRIVDLGSRRGPAAEAQALYEDLTPARQPADGAGEAPRRGGPGRPTKRERRDLERARDRWPESC